MTALKKNFRLSKSKLMAFSQCPKRLFLEVHKPHLKADSQGSLSRFEFGYQLNDLAQSLYDPKKKGELIDIDFSNFDGAVEKTNSAIAAKKPVFEAVIATDKELALVDVLLPSGTTKKKTWAMIEVKSGGELKPYYETDLAFQLYTLRSSGLDVSKASVAYINKEFVYQGKGDYQGLLIEEDLTQSSIDQHSDIEQAISQAYKVLAKRKEPQDQLGPHCKKPVACGFIDHCRGQGTPAQFPVEWLPGNLKNAIKSLIEDGAKDLRDIPDDLLNETQLRIKKCSLTGKAHFDKKGAKQEIAHLSLPAYFLDFETINLPIPIWKGTRPFQQVPFQYSLHKLKRTGDLDHHSFLDLSGKDPSSALAKQLVLDCGKKGPIFAYNASFEKRVIKELAERFSKQRSSLLAIIERIVDLLPVVKKHYYHPSQKGSWSLKALLPAMIPYRSYSDLNGVQNGNEAMDAFIEAMHAEPGRKNELHQELLEYCELDTMSLVDIYKKIMAD